MAKLTLRHVAGDTFCIPAPANIGVYVPGGRAVLVDSGGDDEAGRQILRLIRDQGWTLAAIVNTHSNADHMGGNAFLHARTGCAVLATPEEAAFIRHPRLEPTLAFGGFPLPEHRNKLLMAKPSPVTGEIAAAGPIADTGLTAIPLPGHFLDMIGVLTPDGVTFLADSLFSRAILEKHPIFFLHDVKGHLETLRGLEDLRADWYIPSHAPMLADIADLIRANRERLERTLALVREACAAPAGFEDVLARVCRECAVTLTANQYVLAGSTVRSMLSFLAGEGVLEAVYEDGRMFWRTAGS